MPKSQSPRKSKNVIQIILFEEIVNVPARREIKSSGSGMGFFTKEHSFIKIHEKQIKHRRATQ